MDNLDKKTKKTSAEVENPTTPIVMTVEEENAALKKEVAELKETLAVLEAQVQSQKAAEAAGIPLEKTFEYEGVVYHNTVPRYISKLTGKTITTKEIVELAKNGDQAAQKELTHALEVLKLFPALPKS